METGQSGIGRRSFLKYVGAAAGAVAARYALGPLGSARAAISANAASATHAGAWVSPDGRALWEPVGYPIPLPGDPTAGVRDADRLAEFVVRDELVLPRGWDYEVLASWGDVFGAPGKEIRFGFNADYTGITPVRSGPPGDHWLIVNHEYISARPWLQGTHAKPLVDADGKVAGVALAGFDADLLHGAKVKPEVLAGVRAICEAGMADLGVSVLRVRRRADGGLEVVRDAADHLRISGASGRIDPSVAMAFTGPSAGLLGDRPVGTFSNCSGATTPWGTFLSCEENFQDQVAEFVTPAGRPLPGDRKDFTGTGKGHPSGLPFEFEGLGTGLTPPLDGRQYGWVIEVDPAGRTLKKHTRLGRFRHENVALRVEAGRPLVAYLGDDRRGGHVWKYVSKGLVSDPADPRNSVLFEDGTLYVARFEDGFKGQWVPLVPGTKLVRPEPGHASLGTVWLPRRASDGGGGGHIEVGIEADPVAGVLSVEEWVARVERFAGKRFEDMCLADLVARDAAAGPGGAEAVILMDAFVMANCVGGTPSARPEDIEVHPGDHSVYISFTDSTGSGDGSPDVRVFPHSRGKDSLQYGALYRLAEAGDDPAGTAFGWGKFVAAGEAHEGGGGFACADNLVFDPAGNLWMVTDITTPSQNVAVDRQGASAPGAGRFVGVFGNNSMFMIPTTGPAAGVPVCFATGPMECEMTGPTFFDDGRALIVSVQHPGELNGTRTPAVPDERRSVTLAARDGTLFKQARTVPQGSNFPSAKPGTPPKPCVVVIRRT